jgi:hypothetical protein
MYLEGSINYTAKCIYNKIRTNPNLAFHEIKMMSGSDRDQKSEFEAALTML